MRLFDDRSHGAGSGSPRSVGASLYILCDQPSATGTIRIIIIIIFFMSIHRCVNYLREREDLLNVGRGVR